MSHKELLDAAKNGQIEKVNLAVDDGIVNCQDEDGMKLHEDGVELLDAAKNGQIEKVYQAVFGGIRQIEKVYQAVYDGIVNCQDEDGFTALIVAAKQGHVEIVKLLLNFECNVDIQEKLLGYTALIYASEYGHEEIFDLLLDHDCNVTIQSNRTEGGNTAFISACRSGHYKLAIALIEAGCDTSLRDRNGACGIDLIKDSIRAEAVKVSFDHPFTYLITQYCQRLNNSAQLTPRRQNGLLMYNYLKI